ncbi:hypothetical protein [Clostridium sp. KNHs205]|uniref:hypothetical protein n=1 Tax=Clostridium sp. KNHs205 TaxID=1449050 RepID=UPI00051B5EF1|nr:hypothetical protein [Clostridium sp. KNHs205]
MFLSTRKLTFLGLLLAVTVLLIVLSGILEFNTLFLLAVASFGVGIAVREAGVPMGVGYLIGSIALGFFLAPNKLYCITYGAMAIYLLVVECIYDKLLVVNSAAVRGKLLWVLKYLIFNLLFIPMLLLFPGLIYAGKIDTRLMLLMFAGGQVLLFLYDKGYRYFQGVIWERVRTKLKL